MMMASPYMMASRIERLRLLERFRKKLTVIGIMGHTQGVSRASSPAYEAREEEKPQ